MKKTIAVLMLSLAMVFNVTPSFYVYAAGDPADSLKAAEKALAAAKAELAQAQAEYDAFLRDNPDMETRFAEAKQNLEEAEATAGEAALAYESAKAKADNAAENVEDKTNVRDQAKDARDGAAAVQAEKAQAESAAAEALAVAEEKKKAALENALEDPEAAAANAELEEAKATEASAQNTANEKNDAWETAKSELTSAESAKQTADAEYEGALAAEGPYQDAANQAQTAVQVALEAKDTAETERDGAQSAYDDAVQAETDAVAAVEAATTVVQDAERALTQAEADEETTAAALSKANEDKAAAKQKKDAADAALAANIEEGNEKLDSYDFFVWLSQQSSQNTAVRNSAATAARMLKNQMTAEDNDLSSKILNDGRFKATGVTPRSYSEIISYTHIAAEGDATNWANFKYAVELAKKGNTYRALEGLAALEISPVMMAMGEINANYQSSIPEDIEHSLAFYGLENLSYNWGASSSPKLMQKDPYDGWYTEEKSNYENGSGQTGHYLTLTDKNDGFICKTTGFGYVYETGPYVYQGYQMTEYTEKYSQTFGDSTCFAGGQDGIAVSSFESLISQYETELTEGDPQLIQAAQEAAAEYDAAVTAAGNAESEHAAAQQLVTECEDALQTANTDLTNKQDVLSQKQQDKSSAKGTLDAAQAVYEEKAAAWDEAKDSLTAAEGELAQKQEETAAAKRKAAEAQALVDEKAAAVSTAESEKQAADSALADAKTVTAAKQQVLDGILAEINAAALEEYNLVKEEYDTAAAELQTADEDLADKSNALNAAQTALEGALTIKEEADNELQTAESNKQTADSELTEAENACAEFSGFGKAMEKLAECKDKVKKATEVRNTAKAANDKAKKVKTVTVNTATVNAKAVDKAVMKAGGSYKYVTKIVLGKSVKRISSAAFKKYTKVTTIELKTSKLTKASVKGSLKSSKVKTVKVKVSSKAATNKKYVTKYKKYFTRANAGRKVTVK